MPLDEYSIEIAKMETMVAEGQMTKTVITTPDGYVFTCYDYADSPINHPSPFAHVFYEGKDKL